jgi:hypothetical protein
MKPPMVGAVLTGGHPCQMVGFLHRRLPPMKHPCDSNKRTLTFPLRTFPDRQTKRLTNRLGFKHSPVNESGIRDFRRVFRPGSRQTIPQGARDEPALGRFPKPQPDQALPPCQEPTTGRWSTVFRPMRRHAPVRECDRSRCDGPLLPPRRQFLAHPPDERAASPAKEDSRSSHRNPKLSKAAFFPHGHRQTQKSLEFFTGTSIATVFGPSP